MIPISQRILRDPPRNESSQAQGEVQGRAYRIRRLIAVGHIVQQEFEGLFRDPGEYILDKGERKQSAEASHAERLSLRFTPGFRSEFDRNSQFLRGIWGTRHRFCKGVTEV